MTDNTTRDQTAKQEPLPKQKDWPNLVQGRWRPGQSGNPGGRPKKKVGTEALQRIFAKLSDAEAETWAMETWKKAAAGDIAAFKEVLDRVEGRVSQPIGGAADLPDLQIQAITRTIIEPAVLELDATETQHTDNTSTQSST